MQRLPSNSTVTQDAARTIDPGSFADGDFCIIDLQRSVHNVSLGHLQSSHDRQQRDAAWNIANVSYYNLYRSADEQNSNGKHTQQTT